MGRFFCLSISCRIAVRCCAGVRHRRGRGAATETDDQREIVVTGERQKSAADATSTATKTNTDIKDIPQALTIVSEKQIADQQLRSVADLLNFVPGASYGSGEGNRDQIVLRGNSSTADFFVDGVRDDVQYFRDFYNVERVEVLKGPNAMIFGRGGGGGIVNRVLKRPSFSRHARHHRFGRRLGRTPLHHRPRPAAVGHGRSAPQRPLRGQRQLSPPRRFEALRHQPDRRVCSPAPTRASTCPTNISTTAAPPIAACRHDGDEPLRGFTRTFFGDPRISHSKAEREPGDAGRRT